MRCFLLASTLQNSGYQVRSLVEILEAVRSCRKLLPDLSLNLFAMEDAAEQDSVVFDATALLDIRDIKNTLDGDDEAYKKLIERHQKQISSMMWRFSRDTGTHEELVQDVFVQVFLSLHTFKQKSPFTHWLCRIATRVGFRYWKTRASKKNTNTISLEDWDQAALSANENIEPDEAGEILHRMLAKLPSRDRLVLTMRYLEQHSVNQTAEVIGWSVPMVKVQTWRAKNKLKKLFEQYAPETGE
jgi:RNA polymerase sigma-70 factor (ECF subfamily)